MVVSSAYVREERVDRASTVGVFVSCAWNAGNPFAIDEDGLMSIPTGPGLGISWSDAGILKHTGLEISNQITGVVEPPTQQVLSSGTSGHSYGECSHKQRQRL